MRLAWAIVVAGCGGTATGGEGAPQKVFVEFDGIVLQQGSEDATTNTSSAIAANLSPFLASAADRELRITQILGELDAILTPFRLEVVTERPEIGRYDMIVIGGTPQEAGLDAGLGGVAAVDCANATPNKIVVVFGNAFPAGFGAEKLASLAIAGLGSSQGIPSSNVADDCLCWKGIACENTRRCTFGGPGTPIAGGDPCAGEETTMDPTAEFAAIYPLASAQ